MLFCEHALVLTHAEDFSDGVAWVKYTKNTQKDSKKRVGLIDKTGKILFSYSEDELDNIS